MNHEDIDCVGAVFSKNSSSDNEKVAFIFQSARKEFLKCFSFILLLCQASLKRCMMNFYLNRLEFNLHT